MSNPRGPQPSRSSGGRSGTIIALVGLLLAGITILYGDDLLCRSGVVHLPTCEKQEQPSSPGGGGGGSRPSGNVRWQGALVLRMVTGVELDTNPPHPTTGEAGDMADGDLFYDNREALGNRFYAGDQPFALWESGGLPDAKGCADAVSTSGTYALDPKVGQVLCVRTTGGRMAALTVVDAQYGGVRFDAVVWE
jgi:hypothetical protein